MTWEENNDIDFWDFFHVHCGEKDEKALVMMRSHL
jgi:hypothetical protein